LFEKPQFLSAKGTTKKAEALELFVYPNEGGPQILVDAEFLY
jgi:hypothetical protein